VSDLSDTAAACVLLKASDADAYSGNKISVEDPYLAYAKVSALFETRPSAQAGIAGTAFVDPSAEIADNVSIGPGCYVGAGAKIGSGSELLSGVHIGERVQVGESVTLFPNVVLYHDVILGDRVRIQANSTIGCDGFGYAPSKDGWQKIHQIGRVVIGSDVEIGANVSIDRGALEDTEIHDGVIIDNQVHIAHNVVIGERTAIAGCVGIAGSTTLGKNCIVAGMVAINGHLNIADNTHYNGGTVVTKGNSESGAFASAAPQQDVGSWRKTSVRLRQLDTLFNKVKQLEKAINSKSKS
jgi:UDP-3-O-[3-hydroxymyristoyl] glucosamine N-acyltransferase